MKLNLIIICLFLCGCVSVPNKVDGIRIYNIDKFGNIEYHKESQIIIKDKIYTVDKYGTILYHKPSKKIAEK